MRSIWLERELTQEPLASVDLDEVCSGKSRRENAKYDGKHALKRNSHDSDR